MEGGRGARWQGRGKTKLTQVGLRTSTLVRHLKHQQLKTLKKGLGKMAASVVQSPCSSSVLSLCFRRHDSWDSCFALALCVNLGLDNWSLSAHRQRCTPPAVVQSNTPSLHEATLDGSRRTPPPDQPLGRRRGRSVGSGGFASACPKARQP